ncbi:MAG: DUF2330 domain-containing protein [Deltaproteobacteria bacterium]|nr:DUF2330 domain-containing protein [Deltaproteobacteria bacterium]
MKRLPLSRLAFAALLAASALAPAPAHATARFFADSSDVQLDVAAHRMLTVWRGGKVTLTVQPVVGSTGGEETGRLGYVLPVHGIPELVDADPDVFSALFGLTGPAVVTERQNAGDGCDSASVTRDEVFTPSVDDLAGTPSAIEATVISPSNEGAVRSWLTGAGLAFTDDDVAALKAELDGGARLVGVTFPRTGALTEPAPVAVTFFEPPDIRLELALAQAAPATPDLAETTIFVVADKRFRILDYGSVDLAQIGTGVHDQLAAGRAGDYDAALDAITMKAGGRVFVTEFSVDLDAGTPDLPASVAALVDDERGFLTRLHARVPADSMADPVVTFAKDGPEVVPETVVPAPGVTLGLGAGLLLALGLLARRRRRVALARI